MAAEYVMAEGNERVVLCERGIRTFETATRNTLDVERDSVLKSRDASAGDRRPEPRRRRRRARAPLALAAIAAGADGLIVEVHPDPEHALSDGPQALHAAHFADFTAAVAAHARLEGKTLA